MKVEFNTEKDKVVIRQNAITDKSNMTVSVSVTHEEDIDCFSVDWRLPIPEAKRLHEELGKLLKHEKS